MKSYFTHYLPATARTLVRVGIAFMFCASIAHAELDADVAAVDDSEQVDSEQVKVQLEKAKAVLRKAEDAAQEIIKAAEMEASEIVASAGDVAAQNYGKNSPLAIRNQDVAVELRGATIEEIANAIMPEGWRVLVDVEDVSIKERRFQYVSTKTRDQALIGLTKPLDLTYRYFFNLKDEKGSATPLLVISEK